MMEQSPEFLNGEISIRIPGLDNVPLTKGIASIIDSAEFQRLRKVRQLSLTHLVYPGANHTRFEHSLGVFNLARKYIIQLRTIPEFNSLVSDEKSLALLLSALLHDIGHYPFGHIVETMVSELPHHEFRGQQITKSLTLSQKIADLGVDPVYVGRLICGDSEGLLESEQTTFRLLRDLLDCAIDADKMDYLERDSIHCGIPYGRSYDKERLIGSLIVSRDNRLAITDKGKASAEYVAFSRYVMLTEVYWHHTVRSASVMLIRAFQETPHFPGWADFLSNLLEHDGDEDTIESLAELVKDDPDVLELVRGILNRSLYKRVRTYSPLDPDSAEVFKALETLDNPQDGKRLSMALEEAFGLPRMRILVDIVPAKSIAGDLQVYYPKRDRYRPLSQISPVVGTLSKTWKTLTGIVRIYCHRSSFDKIPKDGEEIDKIVIEVSKNI